MYKISLILGFICFNCIVSNFLFAQNPGGVEKPIIWKQNIVSDYRESISAETFNFNKYLKIAENGKELNLPIGNLNKFSLFLSVVGRVSCVLGTFNCLFLYFPAITLITYTLLYLIFD